MRAILLLLIALSGRAEVTAFVGVNVLPMDTERTLLGQTVVVRDGIIESLGAVDEVPVPHDARVIYGHGRWLMPGLIDMHVHIRAGDLQRYIDNGITSVRDLAGLDSVLAIKRANAMGPRIFVASHVLVGPGAEQPPFSRLVARPQDAQSVVDAELARGCDSIKVYEGLTREVYDAIIAAAARGVRIGGHVTANVSVVYAMTRQDSIEHLSGYPLDDPSRYAELASASRDSGVWNCPTQTVFRDLITRNLPPETRARILAERRAFVAALHAAGARILAGTDAGYLIPAGTSLHDELDELLAAGLTPFEVLSAATRSAAEYLQDDSIGIIAVGRRADFVLVNVNPLERISALRRPNGVMLGGRWISYERRRAVRK